MVAISRKRKKAFIIILSLLILIALIAYGALHFTFRTPILAQDKNQTIYIDRDDTIDSVYTKLQDALGRDIPKGFTLLSEQLNYPRKIRPGKYTITTKDTNQSLVNKLIMGYETPTKLVFNNIRTKEQLAGRMANQLMIDSLEIISILNSEAYLKEIGYTPETIVSVFIPNTYEVYWSMTPQQLINRFLSEYSKFWNAERTAKAETIGFSKLEVSIIASIVEEETNIGDEKPTVAGLYINRLKRGIPLQADPTLKFALQDFTIKRILDKDKLVESPYNTYKYAGLPPGPIGLATQQGLESVLNYQDHNYLYMCAKEDFSGRHNFSTNYAEHIAHSRRYWKALNQRKIYR